jgi:hypothetical protein
MMMSETEEHKLTLYERLTHTPHGRRALMWLASISGGLISFAAIALIGWVWNMNSRLAVIESQTAQDEAQWRALRDIREDMDSIQTQTELHRYMFDTTDRKIYIQVQGVEEDNQLSLVPRPRPLGPVVLPAPQSPEDKEKEKLAEFRRIAGELEKARRGKDANRIKEQYIQQQEQRVIPQPAEKR